MSVSNCTLNTTPPPVYELSCEAHDRRRRNLCVCVCVLGRQCSIIYILAHVRGADTHDLLSNAFSASNSHRTSINYFWYDYTECVYYCIRLYTRACHTLVIKFIMSLLKLQYLVPMCYY